MNHLESCKRPEARKCYPRTLHFDPPWVPWSASWEYFRRPRPLLAPMWTLVDSLARKGTIWARSGSPFRGPCGPQSRIKSSGTWKNRYQENKQTKTRLPTPPQIAQWSFHTVNTTCFKGSAQVYLNGFGVTLGSCLGWVFMNFRMEASFWRFQKDTGNIARFLEAPGSEKGGVPPSVSGGGPSAPAQKTSVI